MTPIDAVPSVESQHLGAERCPNAPSPFVSYSRVDSAFAMRLAEDLGATGAVVWLDQLSIEPGTQWDQAVEIALKSAPCVLLILSPASVKSKNVMDEINFALDENKTLIPVLYQDCEVPWRLRRIQYIDFRSDYARGLKMLVAHLTLGKSSHSPSQEPASTTILSEGNVHPAIRTDEPRGSWFKGRSRLWIAASAATLLAAAAILFSLRLRHPPAATDTSASQATASEPMAGSQKGFTPLELAHLYNFPVGLDGAGQTIALIELGGGYRTEDLQHYFKDLSLPVPDITSVNVAGGGNHPTTAASSDAQVVLDIEVTGAIAPKAKIVVYFTVNSNEAFVEAVQAAANNKKNPTTIMLICWGTAERSWTAPARDALNAALQDAAIRHAITTVVADGDNGISDGDKGNRAVDFPASSPWVLSVGGTSLSARDGKIQGETVWNRSSQDQGATGGGVSNIFPQPAWQQAAHIQSLFGTWGRGVPDVTASADTSNGYIIRVDGQSQVSGGTSASAPLWAGLIALLNQGVGHNLGYLNPALYGAVGPSGAFNDIVKSTNSLPGVRGCTAGPGWDYCSGWGSPNGVKLLEAFRASHP